MPSISFEVSKRQQKAFEESVNHLKNMGQERPSAVNGVTAANQVEWEMGEFDSDEVTLAVGIDRDTLELMTMRGRLKAHEAALNSGQALYILEDAHKGIRAELRQVKLLCTIVTMGIIYLIFT